jgi:hypothetical protein
MAIELAKAETQLVKYNRKNELVKVIPNPNPPNPNPYPNPCPVRLQERQDVWRAVELREQKTNVADLQLTLTQQSAEHKVAQNKFKKMLRCHLTQALHLSLPHRLNLYA